jgi:hypothetical protein
MSTDRSCNSREHRMCTPEDCRYSYEQNYFALSYFFENSDFLPYNSKKTPVSAGNQHHRFPLHLYSHSSAYMPYLWDTFPSNSAASPHYSPAQEDIVRNPPDMHYHRMYRSTQSGSLQDTQGNQWCTD